MSDKSQVTQVDFMFPQPCLVRILMVTDDDGSFSPEHRFGLTELIAALTSAPQSFVKYAITTAHRLSKNVPFTKDAKITEFRFDNPLHFNPQKFDQLWLFGVSNEAPSSGERSPLSPPELRIISQFMDAGGGVFATGDHENLGKDLCGAIPRVRSMRRWDFDYTAVSAPHSYDDYDESSDNAPPVLGRHRHDTLLAGHDNFFSFDDQSDDLAQQIIPRMYGYSTKLYSVSYPHPLLCGPKGIIRVLPDHMHEGECLTPDDLSQTTTFDGYSSAEYPSVNGVQPIPDVIAQGFSTAGHKTRLELKDSFGGKLGETTQSSLLDVAVVADTFGTIGAYDGHEAQVGRVVVDSTFHHFFNINLNGTGSNVTNDPIKNQGFNASPAGQAEYEQIKAYFRNIALYLAPRAKQECMLNTALWIARWETQMRFVLQSVRSERLGWSELLLIGRYVREVLERNASRCTTVDWQFAFDNPLSHFKWWQVKNLPDPPPEVLNIALNPEELITAMYGAIMLGIAQASPSRDVKLRDTLHRWMPEVVKTGVRQALSQVVPILEARITATSKFVSALNDSQAPKGKGVSKKRPA
jgi:hypothetical protein